MLLGDRYSKLGDLSIEGTKLNGLVPSIEFKIEREENNCISFLDVKIIKVNNEFKFKIHRKSTNNNLLIHATSHHTKEVKQSALRSMFLRALNLVSPEYFDEEIAIIYDLGLRHGFTLSSIDRCFSLAKKTFYSVDEGTKFNIDKAIVLPYTQSFEDIIHPLNAMGYSVAFSYPSNVGKFLIRNSPRNDSGIVYKIPCGCGKFYVGQSGKTLEKRISQHKYSVATNQHCNAISCHSQNCYFPIKWKESEILYKNNSFTERNLIETACIQHSTIHNFNTSTGLFNVDPLFLHVFKNQYRVFDKLS